MNKTAVLATCCNANDPYLFQLLAQLFQWLLFDIIGLESSSSLGQFLHYFLYTATKIFLLLNGLIYLVGLFRAGLNVEKVRQFLSGKNRLFSYLLAALFGALTPFCSCAAVPIFIAFTASGIPLGITIAFLVTSPIINEIGILLLFTEFGSTFTSIYISLGMLSGILAGFLFDLFPQKLFVRDDISAEGGKEALKNKEKGKLSLLERHTFAANEVKKIVSKVFPWVLFGVTIGGVLNTFVTPQSIQSLIAGKSLLSVPIAVLIGIPLYSSPAGVVPIGSVLLKQGVPIGTVIAFMMSCTAASLPEFILLRRVLTKSGALTLLGFLLFLFTVIGLLLNLSA